MSKIIHPVSQRATEALLYFVTQCFEKIEFSNEVISAYICNALYHYSAQQLSVNAADLKGQPCSGLQWQAIAHIIKEEISKHVERIN